MQEFISVQSDVFVICTLLIALATFGLGISAGYSYKAWADSRIRQYRDDRR